MKLSDLQIKALKPLTKPVKYFDGAGLYLEILPSGVKSWRIKYVFDGKEKRFCIGKYNTSAPDHVSLTSARKKLFVIKENLINGIDPSDVKKQSKQILKPVIVDTFKKIALEVIENKQLRTSSDYVKNYLRSLELHVFDIIGDRDIKNITPVEINDLSKSIVKNVEEKNKGKGHHTAHRMIQRVGEVFGWAVATGRRDGNPVSKATHSVVAPNAVENNSCIDIKELSEFISDLEEYRGYPITKLMIKFIMMTAVRTGEARDLKVDWIDFESKIITIPANAHKTSKAKINKGLNGFVHVIPISLQVEKILKRAIENTGNLGDEYVFPSYRNRHIKTSENAVTQAIKKWIGGGRWFKKQTSHGFRTLARTAWGESRKFSTESMELQLGHKIGNAVQSVYDKSVMIDERREILDWWGNELIKYGMVI